MAVRVKKMSQTVVWIIMGLLIVGLAGFGATNLSGTARTIGSVGDEPITINAYGRELQREIRAVEAQMGQALQMDQVRALGLDRMVLDRLVTLAALDNEAARLGLSVGDENLQKDIVQISGFQGLDGKFDRATYRLALENANLSEADFEADLRRESARTLLQGALVSGVEMPSTMADTLVDFIGARRSFTFANLTEAELAEAIPEPTEQQLQDYYDAHPDDFRLPETKQITYAWLAPEMLLDTVEVDDAAVRTLYKDRLPDYDQPERRLVERLVFSNDDTASEAMAQLEVNGTTFEQLVADRGLALSDIDMGDVSAEDLGEATEAVFAAETGDVVGPLPSPLGPALFRVNGKLAAQSTPFEDVEGELRDELAGEAARRQIEAQADELEDRLAGGATLEELTGETDMELGTIDWTPESAEDMAAYDAFSEAAAQATTNDFPEIAFLDDGGVFALRLDEVLPERPQPFEDAREAVGDAWYAAQVRATLEAQAENLVERLRETGDFTAEEVPHRVENALTRTAFIEAAPEGLMPVVFEMEKGEYRVVPGAESVAVVRLDDVLPPDDTPEMAQLRTSLDAQLDQALAQAVFQAYVRDIRANTRARIDQQTLNAVLANFR